MVGVGYDVPPLDLRSGLVLPGSRLALINFLGRTSYAVFLVHFPICLIVNAIFTRFAPAQPRVQAAGMLLSWIASVVAGTAFHRWIELPLARLAASVRRTGKDRIAPYDPTKA